MERLTKKKIQHVGLTDLECEYTFYDDTVILNKIVNKLGCLEDLEEKLGCPLDIFVKAIKNGFYYYIEDMNYIEFCNPEHLKVEYFDNKMCFMNVKSIKIHFDNVSEKPFYCESKEVVYLDKFNKSWWLEKPLSFISL